MAIQQGRYAGTSFFRTGCWVKTLPPPPFDYFDKGTMAVVGKGFAVLGKRQSLKISRPQSAWLTWAAVHLQFLSPHRSLRLTVFLQWVWTYLTGQRGDRLIVNHYYSAATNPAPGATVKAFFAGR